MKSSGNNVLEKEYAEKEDLYYGYSRAEMLNYIPTACKKILDVGCAGGGFAKSLKAQRKGTEVWGIEPHEESAKKAAHVVDHIICGYFTSDLDEIKSQKFDCIVFNDVLEHLADPAKTLEDCNKLLADNGCVVASIPNVLYFPAISKVLLSEDWKYESSGTLDNTHLRFFTKKSIIRLFEENGYKVVKIEGIHPYSSKKYQLLNWLLLNRLKNWRYLQYAIQAQKM